MIDIEGRVIKSPRYTSLRRISKGKYKGVLPDGAEEIVLVEEFEVIPKSLSEGGRKRQRAIMKDRIVFSDQLKPRGSLIIGIMNMEGDTLLHQTKYARLGNSTHFEGQVFGAWDTETDLHGVFGKDGEIIVPFEHEAIRVGFVNDEYFLIKNNSTFSLVDFEGQTKSSIEADAVYTCGPYPYVIVVRDEKYQLLDLNFNLVLNEHFDKISKSRNSGILVIINKGLKGFFSLETEKFTAPNYKKIKLGLPSTRIVSSDGLFGVLNIHSGKLIQPEKYDKIDVKGGFFRTSKILEKGNSPRTTKYSYSLISQEGELIFGPTSHLLNILEEGVAIENVAKDTTLLHFLATKESKEYIGHLRFTDGLVVNKEKGTCFLDEFLNSNCTFYDRIYSEVEGLRKFKDKGKYGLFYKGKIIEPSNYEAIKDSKRGVVYFKLNGKWGVWKNPYYSPK